MKKPRKVKVPLRITPVLLARLRLFAIQRGLGSPEDAADFLVAAFARGRGLPRRPKLRPSMGRN